MRTTRLLLLALGLALPGAVPAQAIYKHVDENGVVHYSDQPPAKGAKPAQLPPLQTVPAPEIRGSIPSRPAAGRKQDFRLGIVTPAPDQVFREPGATIDITVTVEPPLPAGHGLMFYVDGAAATSAPLGSTRFAVGGLERGSHAIEAALIAPDGTELARSSVTVHMMPPAAKPQVTPRR